jgi:hypothetical protein
MGVSEAGKGWLETALRWLSADGFAISRGVDFTGRKFEAVAHRSRIELTKFGNSETFFVFAEMEKLDPNSLSRFTSLAFQYAKQARSVSLPCGFFESVWCFAVCLTGVLDERTVQYVRGTAPAKHWAAAEIPVVYDTARNKLCYYEKTPLWGAAYYRGFRQQISRYLAFSERA